MIIGNLNKDLKGKITTLDSSFKVKITENRDMKKDTSPTHDIFAVNRFGEIFQIGSAWERKIAKGDKLGQFMYSISIDDPAFKSPLNCSAFPSDDGYNITWERPKSIDKEEF